MYLYITKYVSDSEEQWLVICETHVTISNFVLKDYKSNTYIAVGL